MAVSKGVIYLNAREFVVARDGAEAWPRVLAAMSEDDRATIRGALVVGWYPLELQGRFLRALDRVLGKGDGAVLAELGRWSAEHDLTRIHRIFLRMANPAFVLEKCGEYWSRFYDVGTWHVDREAPTRARATLSGFVADEVHCQFIVPYSARLFELVGAKQLKMLHPRCRGRGDPACVLTAEWK